MDYTIYQKVKAYFIGVPFTEWELLDLIIVLDKQQKENGKRNLKMAQWLEFMISLLMLPLKNESCRNLGIINIRNYIIGNLFVLHPFELRENKACLKYMQFRSGNQGVRSDIDFLIKLIDSRLDSHVALDQVKDVNIHEGSKKSFGRVTGLVSIHDHRNR